MTLEYGNENFTYYLRHEQECFIRYLIIFSEEFDNFFVSSNQIHQHINTRNASKLYKQYKRTNYARHTLSNKGADVWNLLESNIKDINSCTALKKQVKQHYLLN
jgi:hypothetical protein